MNQPLHIEGALVWDGQETVERDLFIKDGRIVDEKPNHTITIDLEGYTLFPGLINAHDHLELNHYPRTKFREVYDNAHQWGEDINVRLNDEPFKTLRNHPIWDRLFIGGLKNLLCGATTVAHHGPKYRQMYRRDFPVRVLKKYGWAHSLHFDTQAEVVKSYQSTPKDWPWFIHLAEGTDDVAAGEYQKLRDILPVMPFQITVVHGNGIFQNDNQDIDDFQFVWCPSTNQYLLGETYISQKTSDRTYVPNALALGSDSRLTAAGDLLDEMRTAYECLGNDSDVALLVTKLVWFEAAFVLFYQSEPNWFDVQPTVDVFALPASSNTAVQLCESRRGDLSLVMRDSIPQIGNPDIMAKFPHVQTVACRLDGVEKRMNVHLARQVHRCTLKESGLEVDDLPQGKRFWFF